MSYNRPTQKPSAPVHVSIPATTLLGNWIFQLLPAAVKLLLAERISIRIKPKRDSNSMQRYMERLKRGHIARARSLLHVLYVMPAMNLCNLKTIFMDPRSVEAPCKRRRLRQFETREVSLSARPDSDHRPSFGLRFASRKQVLG